MIVRLYFWSCVFLIGTCYAHSSVRNPFACSHAHGKATLEVAQDQKGHESKNTVTTMATDDTSSEWRVIAEKDETVIMQHKDGSIREITVSK